MCCQSFGPVAQVNLLYELGVTMVWVSMMLMEKNKMIRDFIMDGLSFTMNGFVVQVLG